ncbi:uncharacterized protein [Antedon mediterranea]|uniref:uncharacterized protein n=1 Tax=Antedon mediterranea TaxID=105859 RepID=UPI003AF6F2B2
MFHVKKEEGGTTLEILDKTKEHSPSECQLNHRIEKKDLEVEKLLGIADLNKATIKSLSKLHELYIMKFCSQIIEEGVKYHIFRNIMEVKDMIESFDSVLEGNRLDSFAYFTELNKRLKEGSFKPIVEYQANLPFQRNMLQFQREHNRALIQVLGNFERNVKTKSRISEMDLQLRISKPQEWLTSLYRKSKALNKAFKGPTDQPNHRLQIHTIHMLEKLIQEEQELTKSVEKDLHMTSVLLNLPTELVSKDRQLLYKLSQIKDDWLKKHGCFMLYTKRKTDDGNPLKNIRKKYSQKEIHIYASASVIILTSKQFCNCYDRNYTDIEVVDARNRKSWMPEKGFLFKLWIYKKVGLVDDYQPVEYLLGFTSGSDQIEKDFKEWKAALVVATGESGKYDDYSRPIHIVTTVFVTNKDDELQLDVNDFVELLENRQVKNEIWVRGIRQRDGMSGWFPSTILGSQRDEQYSYGQKIKLRCKKERENEYEDDKSSYNNDAIQVRKKDRDTTTRNPRKSSKDKSKRLSFYFRPISRLLMNQNACIAPKDTDLYQEIRVGNVETSCSVLDRTSHYDYICSDIEFDDGGYVKVAPYNKNN